MSNDLLKALEEVLNLVHNCCDCWEMSATDEQKKMLDEAISAWNRRANGWQKIERAPKDGTYILVADKYGNRCIGFWFESEKGGGFWATKENGISHASFPATHFKLLDSPYLSKTEE